MILRYTIGALLLIAALFIAFVSLRTPSNDRNWTPDVMYAATTSLSTDGIATISYLRDFSYEEAPTRTEKWLPNAQIDTNKIVRTWFLVEPFSLFSLVGHTYLTFEMEDGSAYSFSVEARFEKGEIYSWVHGVANKFEIVYLWGTERDFLMRRLVYFGETVRMYPLTLDRAQSQRLFISLLHDSNEMAKKPRFYNTLTANCTNVLARLANDAKAGSVPYGLAWNLPGLSDGFMKKIGYIADTGSLEEMKGAHDLTPKVEEIRTFGKDTDAGFGKKLRALLPEK